jgi:hypothetical protein
MSHGQVTVVDDSMDMTAFESRYGGGTPVEEAPLSATPEPVEPAEQAAREARARDAHGRYAGKTDEAKTEEPHQEEVTAEKADAKTRHRAESQKAGPEDVPRIRELTRRLRETESRLAEAERRSAPARAMVEEPGEFTEAEPVLETYRNEDDPYGAYLKAMAGYYYKQGQHGAKLESVKAQRESQAKAATEGTVREMQGLMARLDAFAETHADFHELASSVETPFDDLGRAVLIRSQAPGDLVYHLLTHPDDLAAWNLFTDGKAVTDRSVAIATSWLTSRVRAAGTGSAPPVIRKQQPPTPPNPVRATSGSPAEPLDRDSESLSLSEHEKAFSHRRR